MPLGPRAARGRGLTKGHGSASALAFLVPFALTGAVVVTTAQAPVPLPVFKSAIELTTVTATVVNHDGALVTGLPREAFELYEDGQRQPITHFTNERVSASVAILLDVSDSMFGQRIADARQAISGFVVNLLERGDEFSIVAFNHQQRVLTRWTSDPAAATEALRSVRPSGSTAIYDAIIAALPLAETRTRPRAALLMISDGADTASDAGLPGVRSGLLRSDAFVYAVAIDAPDRRPINAPVNAAALSEITNQSGGRTQVVQSSSDLGRALDEVAEELSSQYLIGYAAPHGADGKFHSIRLRVAGTDDRVRARNGYVAERR